MPMLRRITLAALVAMPLTILGCGGNDHDDHDGHDHGAVTTGGQGSTGAQHGGHHGAPVALGTATIGPFEVRASRDEGALTPGGDAPIDVWLTGDITQVAAVRFWIGVQDATGSVKARADIENPDQPNHWHTHVELPSPMPDEARVWVEIELKSGEKVTGSFPLNPTG